jgi:hypothetical protein
MRYFLLITIFSLNNICSSQIPDDALLCNRIKIYHINTAKYLTSCSCSVKNIIDTFGAPDSIIKVDGQQKYTSLFYGQNRFTPSSETTGRNLNIQTDRFRLMIDDSIEIRIGSQMGRILEYFPKSASNTGSDIKNTSYINISIAYSKDQLLDKNLLGTSVLSISFNLLSKKVSSIHLIERD